MTRTAHPSSGIATTILRALAPPPGNGNISSVSGLSTRAYDTTATRKAAWRTWSSGTSASVNMRRRRGMRSVLDSRLTMAREVERSMALTAPGTVEFMASLGGPAGSLLKRQGAYVVVKTPYPLTFAYISTLRSYLQRRRGNLIESLLDAKRHSP